MSLGWFFEAAFLAAGTTIAPIIGGGKRGGGLPSVHQGPLRIRTPKLFFLE